jgi:hypothetical protein
LHSFNEQRNRETIVRNSLPDLKLELMDCVADSS